MHRQPFLAPWLFVVAIPFSLGCSSSDAQGTDSGAREDASGRGMDRSHIEAGSVPASDGGSMAPEVRAPNGAADADGGIASGIDGASDTGSGEEGGAATLSGTNGCGKPPGQETAKYVHHTIQSQNESRDYFVYLPAGYDNTKPYRTVFIWHGCNGTGDQALPLERASKGDAILIAPNANTTTSSGTCFKETKDIDLFDGVLRAARSTYCVDDKRVFSTGFSSGSWMTNYLGCKRAGVIRAQANISGGLPVDPMQCDKTPIAGLFIHDSDDMSNVILGGQKARDRLLGVDTCSMTTKSWDPSPCVAYDECRPGYPVVWCRTSGQGHSREDSLSVPAIWKFFVQF